MADYFKLKLSTKKSLDLALIEQDYELHSLLISLHHHQQDHHPLTFLAICCYLINFDQKNHRNYYSLQYHHYLLNVLSNYSNFSINFNHDKILSLKLLVIKPTLHLQYLPFHQIYQVSHRAYLKIILNLH